jgi:protein TonB
MVNPILRAAARISAGLVLALAAIPTSASGQSDIYLPRQLTSAPRIVSMADASRVIQMAYPENLRSRGIGGTVQLQFVIGPDGRVEEETIRVVVAAEEELGEAAKRAAAKLEFSPPKVQDASVRVRVMLPIVFRPS